MGVKVMCALVLGAAARRQRQMLDDTQQLDTETSKVGAPVQKLDKDGWPTTAGWPPCKENMALPPVTAPGPAPAAPKGSGYYGIPKDGVMTYTVVGDINEIQYFNADCMSSFCDSNYGQKMPDKCCDEESWKNSKGELPKTYFGTGPPDILTHPDTGDQATCYPRIAPGPFDGKNGIGGTKMQWIRNYLGCEDGQLYAHENCVPGGLQYVTADQYTAATGSTACDDGNCPYSYPMSREVGITHFENGTGQTCHCSGAALKLGPGCYIAGGTLAQYAGMYPGVFVRIGGTCDGPP